MKKKKIMKIMEMKMGKMARKKNANNVTHTQRF
jgi:hypothetical protein